MYSFLVLGLVPGTNVQISFQGWLVLMAVLAVATPVMWSGLKRRLLAYQPVVLRTPLDASQLHHRRHPTAR